MTIATMTQEERQIALQKAHESRAAKAAHNKDNEHLYKLDYLDAPRWAELASKYKIRMPAYNEPCTPKGMRKMLRRVGIPNECWKDHYTSVVFFIENNRDWTLSAATGLMLELRENI